MYAEKLSEAARENVRKYPHQHRSYTFRQGADWLMQQPLADRLTNEEKEKIKAIYKREADSMELETHRIKTAENEIAKVCHESNFWQAKLKADMLEQIFGKELFNEK